MDTSARIPHALVPPGYHFRDVQLEMSLKPFWDNTQETCEAVCRELFLQWLPLCRYADSISIMLWVGDGSEILEYEGNPDHVFEWGRYHGSANAIFGDHGKPAKDDGSPGHNAIGGNFPARDPERRGVHLRSYLYRPEPAQFTFHWLRGLVETLKRVGKEITGKTILVGETFDIGPEFAVSRFKYDWHPELCGGGALFGGKFIRCDETLHADQRHYAGFPDGIAEGTTVGKFIGRQTRRFFDDLGFDFLWFSNGFGFALEPWALTGAIFDGSTFKNGAAKETAQKILRFWNHFRAEAPDVPVRTRGTNLCTGIDLGSDASPIREIFRDVPHVEPPVNSPWAALDGDIGLELAGWMSHIARLPGNSSYRFRYYIHDPWWLNSPYLDRYQRSPHDIYLPLAVSRLSKDGIVEPPKNLAFLSVDDSHGCLPVSVPTEVTGYILHAREFAPDAPGPLIWVYPFDAYHDMTMGYAPTPDLPFFGDWFIRGLITHTVPVNTVADSVDAVALMERDLSPLKGSILLAPVTPEHFGLNAKLLAYAEAGGKILLYGPLSDAAGIREALGITSAEGLEGDFACEGRTIRHLPFLSAGGWEETGGSDCALAAGTQDGKCRLASAFREFPSGGKIGWVRGSLATAEYDPARRNKVAGPRLAELPSDQFLPTETLARPLLARMGLGIEVQKENMTGMDPMMCIHRHRNAYVFSGYQPDSATSLKLRLTHGAPVFIGTENRVAADATTHAGPTAWHHLCRFFVQQTASTTVTCRIVPPIQHGYTLRLLLSGLEGATIRFFPEPGTEDRLEILRAPAFPYFLGDFVKPSVARDHDGVHVTVENVTGEILVSW